MGLRVVLAGEEAVGVRVLRLLEELGHRPVLVFSDGDRSASDRASVAAAAAELGLEPRPGAALRDPATADLLRASGAELLLNVHSLHVVAAPLLELPRLGCFNLHPGPLPERPGLNVPSWAIYERATEHGVSLHAMIADVDRGPIADQQRFPLEPGATGLSVSVECSRRGIEMVGSLLRRAEEGAIPVHEQDSARRSWFDTGPPQRGLLEWERPAEEIYAFVRACNFGPFESPWGHPRTCARSGEVGILAAEPAGPTEGEPPGSTAVASGEAIAVATADLWLAVTSVELEGRRLAAADALHAGERLTHPQGVGTVR